MAMIKRDLPLVFMFIVAIVVLADYVVYVPSMRTVAQYFVDWPVILAAFAFMVGALNSLQRELTSVIRRRRYWIFSAVQVIFLSVTIGVGLIGSTSHPIFEVLFYNMLFPLNVTMAALLLFFAASATWRVFRFRNLESAVLLISGIIILLRNAPIASMAWSGFEPLGAWAMDILGLGGNRGIAIGAAIAGVAYGIRIILGYERRWMGGAEE